jgi:hypothetical protein
MTTAFQCFVNDPRWVGWLNEERGPEGKLTKVPYGLGGKPAKADKPETWLTYEEATALYRRIVNGKGGGVGIELGDLGTDQYLVGVDLDSCIDESGCLALWADKILAELDSYAETSPSGKGVKAFFLCASEDIRPLLEALGVTDPNQAGIKRSVGGDGRDHGPGVELYTARRFFAVTGKLMPGKPDRINVIDWPQLERITRLIPPARSTNGSANAGRDSSRSATAFRKAAELRRAGLHYEQMVDALALDPETTAWVREKGMANGQRELLRIWDRSKPTTDSPTSEGVSLHDFYAYMPSHSYIFAPARDLWPAASVNSRIPPVLLLDAAGKPAIDPDGKPRKLSASAWLDRNRPVEQMTWAPGMPMLIRDRLTSQAGWIERKDVACYNLYRPPSIEPGDPAKASRWIAHMHKVYPDHAEHIVRWLAHRVQRPEEKVNHALVLGGQQGIGKDTLLEPVKRAVGPWNWQEISPRDVLGRFNGFAKSVVLRINEGRDLGDVNRFSFYDHMKSYTAAPPDVLRVDEKNLREYYVLNCCGVIITTNHKTDGIYLPADDRRHFVAWSGITKADFDESYWIELWSWYKHGGDRHVAAYLMQSDISGFDPKTPPAKTADFWTIVDAGRVPEDAELADAIESLGSPAVFVLADLQGRVSSEFADWLGDRKNRRIIPHRIEACGYVPIRNPDANDGLWKLRQRRQVIYAKDDLVVREQLTEARRKCDG